MEAGDSAEQPSLPLCNAETPDVVPLVGCTAVESKFAAPVAHHGHVARCPGLNSGCDGD